MKSILIAVAVMVAGLSSGCAQIDYLQDPANYRVNELNGTRMYCHGDSRDNYTPCQGFESKEQIAQREAVAQAKAAENAAWLKAENEREMETAKEAAKLQAIEYKKRAMAEATSLCRIPGW
jgi:hypothetical protein